MNVIPLVLRDTYSLKEVKEVLNKENIKYIFAYSGTVGKDNKLNLFFKESQNSGFQTRKRKVILSKKNDTIIIEENIVEPWITYKHNTYWKRNPDQARIEMGDFL